MKRAFAQLLLEVYDIWQYIFLHCETDCSLVMQNLNVQASMLSFRQLELDRTNTKGMRLSCCSGIVVSCQGTCCALQHLLKDIKLFTSEAEKVDLDSSLLKGLEAVISETISKGLADTDYSAVYEGVNPKH